MALRKWIGTTSSSPTLAANWSGGVAPSAGDNVYISLTAATVYAPTGDATSLGLLNSVHIESNLSGKGVGSAISPFKFYCRGGVNIDVFDESSTVTNHYVHAAANTVAVPSSTIYPDQLRVKVRKNSSVTFYGPAGSLAAD